MRSSQSEEAKWEKQYSQLRSYFKKQGHSRVSSSKHSELSDWVKLQRSERRNGALSDDRVAQLDELSFWWGKDKKDKKANKGAKAERDKFEEFYLQLQDFYREKGHTRAPLTTNLGVWAQKQRTKLREDTISPEHRARLEEINFDYELQSEKKKKSQASDKTNTWDNQCDLLAAFYHEHGHFVVPKRHDLSNWVTSQRRAYREGRLKKEYQDKLEGMHFVWTEAAAVESQKNWEKNYDKLKRFKQRKGHSFVQRDDDILLWRWTEKNDFRQRRGTLPRKRYERLARIGFWDPPPDNLSERGDSTNQDEADIAFVMGSMSDDGDPDNRAAKQDSDADSNENSSDEEDGDEGDDNYDSDNSTDDDENLEEDEDDSPKPKAKRSRNAAPAKSRTKKKRPNTDKKPSARKRLRRSSTFDDEEGFSTRYQVGTKVMKYFEEHGWFQGEIISIYEQNVYKIRYEDDDEETYLIPNEQKDLDQIVANTDLLRYEVGTKIKKHFEGHGWFEGKVIDREEDRYKVRYSDGDKEEYLFHELELLDELVSNARSQ